MKKIDGKWYPETQEEKELLTEAENEIKNADKYNLYHLGPILTKYIGDVAIQKEKNGEPWEAEKEVLAKLNEHFLKLTEGYDKANAIYKKLGISND
ncbi:hypothetical protein [Acetobacter indonesiensis]|uniref:Uncharacterized protein n=1 Tax=Acetobacter indonesiensis TaxID=104101 RepID=A0A252AM81_9PROT|nr:hypothetical protein [Acetobacter indonesiensis]OUI90752.1 hypothetical protein HK17_13465 [Acetobacter indonesiensis]